jgi:hypothetical protein
VPSVDTWRRDCERSLQRSLERRRAADLETEAHLLPRTVRGLASTFGLALLLIACGYVLLLLAAVAAGGAS